MSELERIALKDQKMIPDYQGNDINSKLIANENIRRNDSAVRQSELAKMINGITNEQKVPELGIWEVARTPNNFNVRAQQALQPFMNLKTRDSVTFFDIEALGTPAHLRQKNGYDLFAMTELSFGGTRFNGENFVRNNGKIISMAVAPGKNEYQRLKQSIQELKQNPMKGITQDLHRSILDLTKYADINKFVNDEYGGQRFTALSGHARVPAANTALTTRVLQQAELGLNNLYTRGTNLNTSLSIFQSHLQNTNSKLAGYNIHHYDLPAILSITQNQRVKKYFESAAKKSLDFYHGYSAIVENPYELTGSSLRQEHIHQSLISKKSIKGQLVDGRPKNYLYHLAADDIQANMEIAGFTGKQITSYIKQASGKSSEFTLTPKQLKTSILQKGASLFSYQSGFFDQSKHKYNLVARVNGDEVSPRWSKLDTPIPSNERFEVNEFYHGVQLPNSDKTGYGVRLDSRDITGKSVMLFSETEEELAQQIHGSFLPLSKRSTKGFRKIKAVHDQPYEEYKKMFENNGWNKMVRNYDLLTSKTSDLSWKEHVLNSTNSEELALKFPHMVSRLEGEQKLWSPIIDQLKGSNLTDDQKTMVLRHVKKQLDELGDNRTEVTGKGAKFFSFAFGNNDQMVINAKDSNSIKNAFRGYIKGRRQYERLGEPETSYKIARIGELRDKIIDQFNLSETGPEAAKIKAIAEGMIGEVQSGGKIETALTGLSNMVRYQVEAKGTNTFTREVTNRMTEKRINAINKLSENLPSVMKQSIGYAQAFKNGKEAFGKNTVLSRFAQDQDRKIKDLFERNFKMGNQPSTIQKAADSAAKYSELLKGVINSYKSEFNTQVHFREDGKPYLVLSDKKSGIDTREIKSFNELVRNPKTSVVALPYMDDNLMVRWGSERKVPIMRSGIRNGTMYHSTSVTDALSMMANQANNKSLLIKQKGEAGIISNTFFQIESSLKHAIGQQVSPVSGDAFGMLSHEENKMFAANSSIASRARSGMWDISGYAENWYRENAVRLGFATTQAQADKQANDIATRAKEKFSTFAKEMPLEAKSMAIGGSLHEFATARSGLKGSMHGLNNLAASRMLVGTNPSDTRQYTALGNLMGDSGENPLKTINYRKLDIDRATNVLTRNGQMKDYRINHSFVSDAAYNTLNSGDQELRGLALKTGFITDAEIADKLKDADRIAKYKKQIDEAKTKGRISDFQARQMKRSLDSGMLSTSEGMAVMDAELLSAYDGWDEVRIRAEGDVKFHPKIEDAIQQEAIKQGLAVDEKDKSWKRYGITLDKPIEVDLKDHFDSNGKITLGDYTVNGVKGSIEESKRLRPDKKIAILGYNTDDPFKTGLILGRERLSGQGTKIVTESGYRGTVTPMLKEIISDIYGVEGTEFLREHLPEKKSATSIMDNIRGIDMDIRQQFDGSVSKRIKGFENAEEALNAFYKDIQGIGVNTHLESDGVRTVRSDFGFNQEGVIIDRKEFENLSDKWKSILGQKRDTAASIVMAHNVDTNYFGGVNSGKITPKEIDMIDRGFQLAGITKPGEKSNYASFLTRQVFGENTSPEVRTQQKVFSEIVKAMGNRDKYEGWVPKAGDAVIDYTSEGNAALAHSNAEVKDGILHVSKDNFNPIPEKTVAGQMFTVSDYNKTIVNAGATPIKISGSKEKTLNEHLLGTKGTAYLKLPEFMEQQYIPLIDVNSMKLPGEGFEDQHKFLNNIQGKYAAISRRLDEYNKLHVSEKLSVEDIEKMREGIVSDLDRDVSELTDIFRGTTSNKGSQNYLSRRLENSTRLGSTGVNPVLAYKKEDGKWVNRTSLEESHIYMNKEDVRNQIKGVENRIAQSWGVDTSKIEGDISDFVIQNFNKHDTFVLTHRNPSINTSTLQVAKVKISDAVGKGQMASMRGMSERIKEDYDGDQKGVLFSHYREQDDHKFHSLLNDLKESQKVEYSRNMERANIMMSEIEGTFRSNLADAMNQLTGSDKYSPEHKQINNIAEKFFTEGLSGKNLTLGHLRGSEVRDVVIDSLQKSHTDAYVENPEQWGMSKNGETALGKLEHERTLLARTSGVSIGSADNIRMRMSAAFMANAETKYKHFNNAEGALRYTQDDFIRETATVNEFLREFSQKAISTKHTGSQSGENAVESAISDMYNVMNRVRNVRDEGDLDDLAHQIIGRGMFKEAPTLEIGKGQRFAGTNVDFVKNALSILRDSEKMHQTIGTKGSKDPSLALAASQGIGEKYFSEMIQNGEHIPTLSTKYLSEVAKQHNQTKMAEHEALREEAVVKAHEQKFANIEDRLGDSGAASEIMQNKTKATPLVRPNESMAVHRTIRDHIDDATSELATTARHSFGGSAASALGVMGLSFGALWATSALTKSAPTPEGLQEMAPVSPEVLGAPTARVAPKQNGEYINIQVSARAAQRMNHEDIAAMINNEIMSMSNVKLSTNINVNDNSQKIDRKWMDNAIANAMDKGYAYS
ncbi:hypothetical protein [Bacillus subtilis]|uniref:hypothetical protein n=1 Tax=Bacillus subtilis TaxID=1423 RepID=UPI0021D908EB|nr:hypothetical protein [Bacillus subtilis]